jgi:hypothetical protein
MRGFFESGDSGRSEREREVLLRIKARGKRRFVWQTGVLVWGGFMFIFTNAVDVILRHKSIEWSFLPISLVIWLAVGYGFGEFMWRSFEKKFNRMTR